MKTVLGTTSVLLAAALCVTACTTEQAAPSPKGDASAGTGGGQGTGGDNTNPPPDDSGVSPGPVEAAQEAGPAACIKVPASGLITDFSGACPTDAGMTGQACFGTYGTSVYGGTWASYPAPDGGGVDTTGDSAACESFPSQTTMATSINNGAWEFKGTVATWSGAGIWLAPCVNATGFTGIQFTVSGDAGDSGSGLPAMSISVAQLSNWAGAAVGGTCTAGADGCKPATVSFEVTPTPTQVQLPWTGFSGGLPEDSITDPSKIIQMQWQFDWPCAGGVPYPVDVTIDDLKFYKLP